MINIFKHKGIKWKLDIDDSVALDIILPKTQTMDRKCQSLSFTDSVNIRKPKAEEQALTLQGSDVKMCQADRDIIITQIASRFTSVVMATAIVEYLKLESESNHRVAPPIWKALVWSFFIKTLYFAQSQT